MFRLNSVPNLPDNQLGVDAFEVRIWNEFCEVEIQYHAYAKHLGDWIGEFQDLGPRIFGQPEYFIEWAVGTQDEPVLMTDDGERISELLAQLLGTGLEFDWLEYRDQRIDGNQSR